MKLNKIDYSILILFTILFFFFSSLAYKVFNQRVSNDKNSKPIGEINSKYNHVFRKYVKRFIWENIEEKNLVYLDDTILTKENSGAVIILYTGAKIKLEPDSLIQINMIGDSVSLNLKKGIIQADGDSKNTLVQTSSGLIANLNNSAVTISEIENKTGIYVKDGNLQVQNNDGNYDTITSGKSADISAGQLSTKKINITNITPEDSEVFFTNENSKSILLQWDNIPNVKEYTVTISQSYDLKNSKNIKVTKNEYNINLDKGTWYWQVSGYNNLKEKENSNIHSLNIQNNKKIEVLTPNDQSILLNKKDEPVFFKWNSNETNPENSAPVRLKIAKDPQFKTIIKNEPVNGNSHAINGLEKGMYYWKITPDLNGVNEKNKENIISTKRNVFIVEDDLEKLKHPEGLQPTNKIKCTAGINKQIKLEWLPVRGAKSYQVRLYFSQKNKVSDEVSTTSNSVLIEVPWSIQYLYWEVIATSPHNKYKNFTINSIANSRINDIELIIPSAPNIIVATSSQ